MRIHLKNHVLLRTTLEGIEGKDTMTEMTIIVKIVRR